MIAFILLFNIKNIKTKTRVFKLYVAGFFASTLLPFSKHSNGVMFFFRIPAGRKADCYSVRQHSSKPPPMLGVRVFVIG
jgi:hypothetical protein